TPQAFSATCHAGTPSEDAKLPAGPHPGRPEAEIIIGGRLLTPSGRQMALGGFPLSMRFVGGRTRLPAPSCAAAGNEQLRIVGGTRGAVVASESYNDPHGLFYGLAVKSDGRRIYASGGGENVVHVLDVDPQTGALTAQPDFMVGEYPAGLALSLDDRT